MKSLIRFEDTYGLTDIFCAQHKIPYLDISKKQQRMIQVTSELFVDFGLASGWTSISNNEAYALMERGIERVIFVYDMDNLKGDKTKILSRESLSSVIKNNRLLFENLAYSIELYYVPVVYAAETIMLYQYLDEKYDISVTSLVNSINTNAQHLYLLAYLIVSV